MANANSEQLIDMLKQVVPSGDLRELSSRRDDFAKSLESLARGQVADPYLDAIQESVDAIEQGRPLEAQQQWVLKAIVLPRFRPVVDVINDSFGKPEDPWSHFGSGTLRKNIETAIPSIGRIELPNHPSLPYGGTGFVVGDNLIMTNRHVAEIFATGLGQKSLAFKEGLRSAIDFVQEIRPRASTPLNVRNVLMIHPYWDMAILEVEGLQPGHPKLKLNVELPESLLDRDIAVVGYPAQDPRNDLALQMQVFRQAFNVKRMQPGKLKAREKVTDGYSNSIMPLTHDASTLGGNSGSAVIDASTGEVIGLHFSGRYLKANYCVPTYELARDARVVALGINFTRTIPATASWETKWKGLEKTEPLLIPDTPPPSPTSAVAPGSTTFTVPLQITISLGGNIQLVASGSSTIGSSISSSIGNGSIDAAEALKIPVVYPRLTGRKGFDATFLDLDDGLEIPLPKLTATGRKVAVKLEDDSYELKYHHFSVILHKLRRMAIVTASNVDWRPAKRLIDGHKPTRKELTGLDDNDQEQWVTDPRIPEDHQLPDVFYTKDRKAFDKGHLVRRDDVCWGKSFTDIQKANGDTYHTTNCSPQVAGFNQSAKGKDNWGDLESLVQSQTKAEKAIVLAGPIFDSQDPVFHGVSKHGEIEIPIPRKYWKIIVTKGEAGPEAFGFVLAQDLSNVDFEMTVPKAWQRFTKSLAEIEEMLGGLVRFGKLINYDRGEPA